jgi:branched-chain amino acid transport system substrate-binding protein
MPTREQAGVYASVVHYLKTVAAMNTDDAAVVNAAMRRLPVDRFGAQARILPNGRVVYDLGIYRVKAPDQSRTAWDYYERIATVPAAEAFRSLATSGCSAVEQAEANTR